MGLDSNYLKQGIKDYFNKMTEEEFEIEKKKSNWEFYNSKIFQCIRIFSDESEDDSSECKLCDRVTIHNIYDNDGNVIETDVVFEFSENGWRKVDV